MGVFTGYLLEKSLAIDNVFVWLMILRVCGVACDATEDFTVRGDWCDCHARTVMIFTGAWLVAEFSWILYILVRFTLHRGKNVAKPR